MLNGQTRPRCSTLRKAVSFAHSDWAFTPRRVQNHTTCPTSLAPSPHGRGDSRNLTVRLGSCTVAVALSLFLSRGRVNLSSLLPALPERRLACQKRRSAPQRCSILPVLAGCCTTLPCCGPVAASRRHTRRCGSCARLAGI